MATERGLSIESSTLCRWAHEYAPELSNWAKLYLGNTSGSWRLDETSLKIKGVWQYLYRAIDKEGQTLDWMLSRHRNKHAAKRFSKRHLAISMSKYLTLFMSIRIQLSCPRMQNYSKKVNL
jgi:IS6 family transposase